MMKYRGTFTSAVLKLNKINHIMGKEPLYQMQTAEVQASLRIRRACAPTDFFDGKSEEIVFSRYGSNLKRIHCNHWKTLSRTAHARADFPM